MASKAIAQQLRSDLLKAHDEGKSVLEISSVYGLSRSTISKVLKEEGREIKRGRPSKKKAVTASV